jgi:hypothetical protein
MMPSISSFFQQKKWLCTSWIFTGSFFLLLPLFFILFHFSFKQTSLRELEQRVELLKQKTAQKESKMKQEEKVLNQISQSKSGYIQEVLESMAFLAVERQKWQLFAEKIEPSKPMKERVSFLERGDNRLKFIQGETLRNELFQETEETQETPIEMSEEDLKTLLCYVEGTRIHPYTPQESAPQLVIKSFELEKKVIPEIKEKTYRLQMQLIKREKADP